MRYTGMATGGGGYNRYGVGAKAYGGGRPFPTNGRVDPTGYRERDMKEKARRDAMLKKMRAGFQKNYGSAGWLRNLGG